MNASRVSVADLRALVRKRTQGWLPVGQWGPVCAGCGAAEYRLDGYCSLECRDYHSDEDFEHVSALVDVVEQGLAATIPLTEGLSEALDRFER